MFAGVYIKPKPNPAKNPKWSVNTETLSDVEERARNVVDIKTPMVMVGANPNFLAKMDESEEDKYWTEEWVDAIQATLASLEFKSLITVPKSSPKLNSIPRTIAFERNAQKHTHQDKAPSSL